MLTVLIVDDEPLVRWSLVGSLKSLGLNVLEAESGEAALDIIARGEATDIALVDWKLPGIDGSELLRRIKRIRNTIEVIFMTTHSSIELAVEAMKDGAFDFVAKPFNLEDFEIRVKKCAAHIALKRDLAAVAGPVFLSYAREDAEPVRVLYFNLRSAGFQPWMDVQDLRPGQQWQDAIADEIRNAAFFLACLTEHSVSKRGMVQKELRIALEVWQTHLDSDVYVIPVRFSDCAVPPQIARFQWVDYFAPNGWQQLEEGLRQGLRHRANRGRGL